MNLRPRPDEPDQSVTKPTVDLKDVAQRRFRLGVGSLIKELAPLFEPQDDIQRRAVEKGLKPVSFANYDYLGLGRDDRVRSAAAVATGNQGVGVGASRLAGGERQCHRALEENLSSFLGVGACLALVSGYLTNTTLISHITGKSDLIIMDELSHSSVIAGTRSGAGTTVTFRHNDLDDLVSILEERRGDHRHAIIIVEGLYSMDGDIPDLPRLLHIKRRFGCWLLIDEAHSIGVLGATGRGVCEHFGVDRAEIELTTGTLSKAMAACGGFVAGHQDVINWLRYTVPGFVFSVGMPPATAAAADMALTILQQEPERVQRLHQLSEYFVEGARRIGLSTGDAIGRGVVPVMLMDRNETIGASFSLLERGIYCPSIVQIGVPRDQPRLRFFISSSHTHAEIDAALAILADFMHAFRRKSAAAE